MQKSIEVNLSKNRREPNTHKKYFMYKQQARTVKNDSLYKIIGKVTQEYYT